MAFVSGVAFRKVRRGCMTECRRDRAFVRRVGLRMSESGSLEKSRKEKLLELQELARIEEKYGRADLVSEKEMEALRDEGIKQYNQLLVNLVGNTIFLGGLGAGTVSGFYPLPFVASYSIGVIGSLVYIFLLSRSVDRLATNARSGSRGGDLLGPARLLVLAAIVLFIAKNEDKTGLKVIPATVGFLSYKIGLFLPLLSGEETLDV